jgi:NarL family two-component system sensor histidine kinase YdfH
MAGWWAGRAVHWALLPWLGLLYVWGLLTVDVATAAFQPISTCLFTALMALHAGLYRYGRGLAAAPGRWSPFLYVSLQGAVVVLISVVMQRNLALPVGLSLGLMAEAIVTLPPRRAVTAVGGYGLVCLLSMIPADGNNILQALALFFLAMVPLMLCLLGYVVLYQRQVSERERTQILLRKLETAHAELAAYAERVEDLTILAERRRMARELHDTLAQGLAGLILQFEAVRLHLAGGRTERAGEIIDQAQARARTALRAARHAIDDLRATTDEVTDLYDAVQEEVARFSAATGIACEADVAPLKTLPATLATPALRTISEGLTNVARHAQARHVWVQASLIDHSMEIGVRDDGIGLDLEAATGQAGHYGLLGLRERARLAGARLEVASVPGEGTTLRLFLPLEGRHDG